jgi:putative ABC transport system substrate-binding protein
MTTLSLYGGGAAAQESGRMYRIAHIAVTEQSYSAFRRTVLPELAKSGFIEGMNLSVRSYVGNSRDLPQLTHELLEFNPDVVSTVGPSSVMAASAATSRIPILSFGTDLVAQGLATNLSRPSRNVSGVTILPQEFNVKRLQLLNDGMPMARRIAVIFDPSNSVASTIMEKEMNAAASVAGLELIRFPTGPVDEFPAIIAAVKSSGAQAIFVGSSPLLDRDSPTLASLALLAGLPTVCEWAQNARDGCLIGYGPVRSVLWHRLADQIVRVLRGTPMAEIPIEAPTSFELAINLRTAKALGISVHPDLLNRANEIID